MGVPEERCCAGGCAEAVRNTHSAYTSVTRLGNGDWGINSNICSSLWTAEAANLPPLTEAQKNKLRHLSVVTLAAKIKVMPLCSPEPSSLWG